MRDLGDLAENAFKFWPPEIAEKEREASIIPSLIETQDKFISILNVADSSPLVWQEVLKASSMPGNIFLKHLQVLSDVGGEKLQRFKKELPSVFPDSVMEFVWNEERYSYKFQTLHGRITWDNKRLKIDGKGLSDKADFTAEMLDVAMLILHGGTALAGSLPEVVQLHCIIGSLIGRVEELEKFVKQRYIFVSRITGGAAANALGNISQQYVTEYLKAKLPDWNFGGHRIPGVRDNGQTDMSFDIVAVSPSGKYCAIEASFQVTTNSTIERKGEQAIDRQRLLHQIGHKIAYVIDGAGNFARAAALSKICRHSDCTVTYKDEELDKLVKFLVSIDS